LLTQVAGRAGRGDVEGEVFVQAFTPFHPAIQYARRHDFVGFYDQEIEFREQLKYPPASRLALLLLKGRNEDKVKFSAEHLRAELEQLMKGSAEAEQRGKGEQGSGELGLDLVKTELASARPLAPAPPPADLAIAGPAPAPLARAESHYRYQLMLRTRRMSELSRCLARLMESLQLPDDVALSVDIDPVNLA
jgi:primosomal protein N' (replication factor Y)